jgi:hypothetical protein
MTVQGPQPIPYARCMSFTLDFQGKRWSSHFTDENIEAKTHQLSDRFQSPLASTGMVLEAKFFAM